MLDKGGAPVSEPALEELTLDIELMELELDELDVELETEDELDTELDELFGSAGTGVSSCLLQADNRTATSITEHIDDNVLVHCKLEALRSSPI